MDRETKIIALTGKGGVGKTSISAALDCDLCPLHPICDDVEELRQIHFHLKEKG